MAIFIEVLEVDSEKYMLINADFIASVEPCSLILTERGFGSKIRFHPAKMSLSSAEEPNILFVAENYDDLKDILTGKKAI